MRSLFALPASLIFGAVLTACASAPPPIDPAAPAVTKTSWIVGGDGRAIGQATLTEAPHGVLIRLEFSERALAPGWHGVHIHGHGDCADAGAGFQASGAHVGMGNHVQHGLRNPAGPEAGDLPNVFAPPAGIFGAEFFSPYLTLGAQEIDHRMPLLDADGSALVVHAGPDDQITQPIGGAGARLGCAAFTTAP